MLFLSGAAPPDDEGPADVPCCAATIPGAVRLVEGSDRGLKGMNTKATAGVLGVKLPPSTYASTCLPAGRPTLLPNRVTISAALANEEAGVVGSWIGAKGEGTAGCG